MPALVVEDQVVGADGLTAKVTSMTLLGADSSELLTERTLNHIIWPGSKPLKI